MPFSFSIVEIANITDPDGALVANPGGESNAGAASPGDTITFGSFGDVPTTIDDDVFVDDPASDLSEAITVNGTTFAAGSNVETDYSFIAFDPATDLYFRISHVTINNTYVGAVVSRGFDANGDVFADKYTPGSQLTIVDPDPVSDLPGWEAFVVESNYNLGPGQAYDNDVDLTQGNGVVICFASGTGILMDDGTEAAVETLRPGDRVRTFFGEIRRVVWTGSRGLSAEELAAAPHLRPIRVRAGALGRGAPARDLIVSPQHRLMLSSRILARMIGAEACLAPAKHLLGLPGVETVAEPAGVRYCHVLLDRHDVLIADGAPAESLLLGPEAQKTLSAAALREIRELLPEAAREVAALPIMAGGKARRFVARTVKNGRAALEAA
ncbi:MAG: Hint domain-containing protein [Pseudomonadota bacterium]